MSRRIELSDGAAVEVGQAEAVIKDPQGRVLVRYVDGALELAASGDLRLRAGGNVVVSGAAVHIEARDIHTKAERMTHEVERWELVAGRVVERARESLHEVTELAQHRYGRMRTLVRDVFSLSSRRTELVSDDDTAIDGKRVLLG